MVGMSPIGSYVGGLTSKGRSVCSLGRTGGWMLHMAFSYKAKNIAYNSMLSSVQTYSILLSTIWRTRLSDNQTSDRKPVGLPFRLKNSEHLHAFLYPHKEESTIHHPPQRTVHPFSPERSFVLQAFLMLALAFLNFTREYSSSLLQSARIARSRESVQDSC